MVASALEATLDREPVSLAIRACASGHTRDPGEPFLSVTF